MSWFDIRKVELAALKKAGFLTQAATFKNAPTTATTPGTVTKKVELFDASGTSLGFVAVYGSIA